MSKVILIETCRDCPNFQDYSKVYRPGYYICGLKQLRIFNPDIFPEYCLRKDI